MGVAGPSFYQTAGFILFSGQFFFIGARRTIAQYGVVFS